MNTIWNFPHHSIDIINVYKSFHQKSFNVIVCDNSLDVLGFGQSRGTRTSFRHVRASSKGYFPTMCPQHVAYWCSRAMSLLRKLWINRLLLLYGGWLCDLVGQSMFHHTSRCALVMPQNSVSKGNTEKKRRSLVKIQKRNHEPWQKMTKPCEEHGVPSNFPKLSTEQHVWRVRTKQQLAELEKLNLICGISGFCWGAAEAFSLLRCYFA